VEKNRQVNIKNNTPAPSRILLLKLWVLKNLIITEITNKTNTISIGT